MEPQQYEFRAEMKQLLHLIIHSLYTHQEIFLRELISNASDALNRVRFRQLTGQPVLDAERPLRIDIRLDPEKRTLVIEDSGIGMTEEDLVERIGTVASSGTLAFIQEAQKTGKPLDAGMIGQFGVGFYSAFMVADEITIETRHADPSSQGYRWQSDGSGTYTIAPIDRDTHGTRIALKLREDAKEYSQEYRVRQIVQKYSNFVDFPIAIDDRQVNTVRALWRKNKDEVTPEELEEFYKFISGGFRAPLAHLHLALEGRVSFRALLFIPSEAPPQLLGPEPHRGLHLYTNSVFIREDAEELLPEYLRFVRGVVDTEDLPLNVSREVIQASPLMAKLRSVLTGKILGWLEDLASSDAEKYETFFKEFGSLFKAGLGMDESNRKQIVELLRFESTRVDKEHLTSLKEYVGRMKPEQKVIYYLLAEHREAAERHPSLEYFKRTETEVLLLTHPVDGFTFPLVERYEDRPIRSIEQADLELAPDEKLDGEALEELELKQLLIRFKEILGSRVEDVIPSRRLVDSAATLVTGKQGLDPRMEQIMKMMDQNYRGATRILEVNPAHPLIKNLARLRREGKDPVLFENAVLQLYEGSLLIADALSDPAAFVRRMTDLMVEATD